jgi:hypothetical protein
MEACDVCGCDVCHIYHCDPFDGGCSFLCQTCDLPDHFHETCPDCGLELEVKFHCLHDECGHIKDREEK